MDYWQIRMIVREEIEAERQPTSNTRWYLLIVISFIVGWLL